MDVVPDGESHAGETQLGIYKLEGDTLTVCVDNRERPTQFEDGAGRNGLLLILKRRSPDGRLVGFEELGKNDFG